MKRDSGKRREAWARPGAVRREVFLGLLVLGAFVVGFGVTLLLMPEAQPVRVVAADGETVGAENAELEVAAEPGLETSEAEEASVTESETSFVDERFDHSKLLKDDMKYRGYPRFRAAPRIVPRIQVTRLEGVTPATFHFSISDTLMPGAQLEHDEAVDPWRDLDVRWDFGDAACTDRYHDARYGVDKNPNTDQVGPEAFHVYREPGEYTVTCTVKARTGPDQYTTASTTTLRQNQYQMIYFPQGTTGTFRLEWPLGSGNWTDELDLTVSIDPTFSNNVMVDPGVPGGPQGQDVLDALELLPGLAGNVRLGYSDHIKPASGLYVQVEFCNELGGQTNSLFGVDTTNTVTPNVNKTQKLYYRGPITGGQFRLNFNAPGGPQGQTDWINYNADAAAVAAAINAAVGAGTVTCYGKPIGNPAQVLLGEEMLIEFITPAFQHATFGIPQIFYKDANGVEGPGMTGLDALPKIISAYNATTGHPPYSVANVVWEHSPGGTASTLTVTNGNMATQYYDPVNGNDANAGTEAQPKQTWANLSSWLSGGTSNAYRRALIKRGTSYTGTPASQLFVSGLKYARLGGYGTGDRPRLEFSNSPSFIGSTRPAASSFAREDLFGDVVVDGVDFGTVNPILTGVPSNNQYQWKWIKRVGFLDCYFRKPVSINDENSGSEEISFAGCTFDATGYTTHLHNYYTHWIATIGCVFDKGVYKAGPTNYVLDHKIYPTVWAHEIIGWCDFPPAIALSMASRGSAPKQPRPSYFRYIWDCFMRGTASGINLQYGSGEVAYDYGKLQQFVVDGVWFECGGDTGKIEWTNWSGSFGSPLLDAPYFHQKAGSFANSTACKSATFRNCRGWARPFTQSPPFTQPVAPFTEYPNGLPGIDPQLPSLAVGTPRFSFGIQQSSYFTALQVYGCEFENASNGPFFFIGDGRSYYIVENVFRCSGAEGVVIAMQVAADERMTEPRRRVFDRNAVYVANESGRATGKKPFQFLGGTPRYRTTAQAIAAGEIGPNNVVVDLPWADAASGDFRDNHGANLGGVPVKLKRDRGWAR